MSSSAQPGLMQRALRVLRPTHQHSAYSATLLLMSTVMLSRVVGYLRDAYIAFAFGAGQQTDAYVAAFTVPDFLNYILAGGTTSITFIAIYTRYLANHEEEKAERTFSAIITIMAAVLVVGIAIAEVFAPQITRTIFPHFTPAQNALCVYLTRILLPAQLFFYVGGIMSAVLSSHRMFLVPSLGPIIYNFGIIFGGVLLSHHFGIASLAIGAVAGSFLGPFLVNALGTSHTGIGFALNWDIGDPGFREWIRKTIPLMLGVSLVSADDWILRYFASGGVGDITRLNYAKRLFMVPMAVLGQAAGAASLPFFARLFNEKKRDEFARSVSDSVYRIAASSLLISAWMAATALPVIDIVYRRGRFTFADSSATAVFFLWFGISLAFWSAQAIYSRAFYAAGDTLTPMIATTAVTLAVIPIYGALFHAIGNVGLTIASDIGILVNVAVFAFLLHRKKMVPAGIMRWNELLKSLCTAIVAGALSYRIAQLIEVNGSRVRDIERLALVSLTWAAATLAGLWISRSQLLRDLRGKNTPLSNPSK
ncbi:MAG TPA: murein biosynthesis integral membrane protein MurJ [Terriglobales bacterium]|nr:murein biosynthesis integral membrane protein MurJ [Terriglobales bacterium]